jgi:hypothetical protein
MLHGDVLRRGAARLAEQPEVDIVPAICWGARDLEGVLVCL